MGLKKGLLNLPNELLVCISENLTMSDLKNFKQVCKALRGIARDVASKRIIRCTEIADLSYDVVAKRVEMNEGWLVLLADGDQTFWCGNRVDGDEFSTHVVTKWVNDFLQKTKDNSVRILCPGGTTFQGAMLTSFLNKLSTTTFVLESYVFTDHVDMAEFFWDAKAEKVLLKNCQIRYSWLDPGLPNVYEFLQVAKAPPYCSKFTKGLHEMYFSDGVRVLLCITDRHGGIVKNEVFHLQLANLFGCFLEPQGWNQAECESWKIASVERVRLEKDEKGERLDLNIILS